MATISNLDVNLIAHTKKFDSRIEKSGRKFGGFAGKIGGFSAAKFVGGVGAMVGVVGGLLTVNAAMAKVNAQFDKIDHMAKFADQVGAQVSDLQALGLQAELTGTKQETLEKGIQRFNRTLGEARMGISSGVKAFDTFGISADELSKMSLTEQLGVVADRLGEQASAADKAALAYSLFGRQGQELLTFFDGGADGIQKAADDIDRFGGGLTRVDAAQVEMANDAFTRLDALMNTIWQRVAVEAAPIMTALVEMFTEGAAEFGGLNGIIETGFGILIEGIAFSLNAWNVFIGYVNVWRGAIVQAVNLAVRGLDLIVKGINRLTGQKFDFGLGGLADELQKEASQFAEKGVQQAMDGFAGKAGQDFKSRIEAIKQRAEDAANKPPKPIELPKPKAVDWSAIASSFATDFTKEFDRQSQVFDDLARNDNQPEENRSSVAALTRGSSAAQSLVNKQRDDSKNVAKVIEKSHIRELAALNKQNENLQGIWRALKGGSAVVVGFQGGNAS